MKVIICGGRNYTDQDEAFELFNTVDELHGPITHIIEGGQLGADRLGRLWGDMMGIPVQTITADWSSAPYMQYAGGPIRNQKMLDEHPDALIALPGGDGTDDMVARAAKKNIPIYRLNTLFL